MNWGGLFRAFAPRILGSVASAVAGWVFVHTKGTVALNPTQMVELGTTMILTYGVGHTATAAKVNPAAAASPIMADAGVVAKEELKADQPVSK